MQDDKKAKDKEELGKSAVKKDEKKISSSKSNKKIRDLAEAYAKRKGITLLHPKMTFDVSPERGAKIAQAYEEMKHEPNNPKVKRAYQALINETIDQWNEIRKSGLKVTKITPEMGNPYLGGSKDVIRDVAENNHLYYFPTESGYGSTDVASHPLLQKVKVDNEEMPANDLFRIVHDVFGHVKEGEGFGPKGEENAWMTHKQMYSPEAQKALTSETRGQNSWVNFGPFGEQNRANPEKTTYAEQKAGLLPDWVLGEEPTTGREKYADGGRVYMQEGGNPGAPQGSYHDYLMQGAEMPTEVPTQQVPIEPATQPIEQPTQEPQGSYHDYLMSNAPLNAPEGDLRPSEIPSGYPPSEGAKPSPLTFTREYAPVYDVSGPEPVLTTLNHGDVEEGIRSGKYTFDKNATVQMRAPDGEIIPVAGDRVKEALDKQFTYATPKDLNEEKYGTMAQQAIAFAEGLGRGALSAPLFTGVEKAFGVESEDILGREEAGKAGTAGEVLGFAAPLILTGGEWAAGKAGLEALAGGLGKAAQVASKTPMNLLATKAGQIVVPGSKFVSRIPVAFARNTVEGLVFGASDQLGDAMLNAPGQTAQSALAAIGMSGLVNGVVGTAFGMMLGHYMKPKVKEDIMPGGGGADDVVPPSGAFTPEELMEAGISPARRIKVSEAPHGAPEAPKEYFPDVAEDVPISKVKPGETPEEALKPVAEREKEILERLERIEKAEEVPTKKDVEGLYSDEGFWVKPEDVEKYENLDINTWLKYHPHLLESRRAKGAIEKWIRATGLEAKPESSEIEKAMEFLTDGQVHPGNIPVPYLTDFKPIHLLFDNMVNYPVFGSTKGAKVLQLIEMSKSKAIEKLVGKVINQSEVGLGNMYKKALLDANRAKSRAFKEPYEVVDDILDTLKLTPEEKAKITVALEQIKKGYFPKTNAEEIKYIDDAIEDINSAETVYRVREFLQKQQQKARIAKATMQDASKYYPVISVLKDFENAIGANLPNDLRIGSEAVRMKLSELWPKKLDADIKYREFARQIETIGNAIGVPKKYMENPRRILDYIEKMSPEELYKSLNLKSLTYNEIQDLAREVPEFMDLYRSLEKQRLLNLASTRKSRSEKNSLLNNLSKMPEHQKALLFNTDEEQKLLNSLLLVSKHGDWERNFSNSSLSNSIAQLALAGPQGMVLQAKAGLMYRMTENSVRKALNLTRGQGYKLYDSKRKNYAEGGMVEAGEEDFRPDARKAFVQAVNQPKRLQDANKLAHAVIKGDKMVTNSVKAIFDPKSTYKIAHPTPKGIEQLKTFINHAENNPEGLASIGSDIMPEFNPAFAQAAASTVSYVKSLRPPEPKSLPFDMGVKNPPSAHSDIYNHVLKVAEQPLYVLHKVKEGTVIPEEVGAVKTIYPELYQKLQNQITEHLVNAKENGTVIPYRTKLGLSAFLGSPMDTTMTPEAIMAAQPKPQQPQGQGQMQPKKSTSGLDKMASMMRTPAQARDAEKSQGK